MPGLGQGFKGYNQWILLTLFIKIWNVRHTPLSETDLKLDEDTLQLIRAVWVFSTLNRSIYVLKHLQMGPNRPQSGEIGIREDLI